MRVLTPLPVFILLAGAARAQGPTVSAELKALDWQIGTWEGTMTWRLPGMQGEHKMAFTNEWQGQFLKTTSHMEMNGLALDEIGFVGYDPAKKKYSMHTFTNIVPHPTRRVGHPGERHLADGVRALGPARDEGLYQPYGDNEEGRR